MNSIFGDATSVMPTPQTQAEAASLFSGQRSPVASLDLQRDGAGLGADHAIPGLNIDPPDVEVQDGKPMFKSDAASERSEGLGGWISNIVKRGKGDAGDAASGSGKYRRIDQDED
jgi:hypothetical protein